MPGRGERTKKTKANKSKKEKKISKVMREFKGGELKSSSGDKVTNPKQAKAIALSEADVNNMRKKQAKRKGK